MAQSAVEGTETLWEESIWQAVRNDIAHILGPSTDREPECQEYILEAVKKYPRYIGWIPSIPLPVTYQCATPFIRTTERPDRLLLAELSWHIREVRALVGSSLLGHEFMKFADWEHAMIETAARIWCDWDIDAANSFGYQPYLEWIVGVVDLPLIDLPKSWKCAWESFVPLLETDDQLVQDWLADEVSTWYAAHLDYSRRRERRTAKEWTSVCRAHCEKSQWTRGIPICEAFQIDEGECESNAGQWGLFPPTVARARRAYVPRFPKFS